MSIVQARIMESLGGLSDESLFFLLNMIDRYIKPEGNVKQSDNEAEKCGINIGLFKDETYIAEGYDFDQDNAEVSRIFGVCG